MDLLVYVLLALFGTLLMMGCGGYLLAWRAVGRRRDLERQVLEAARADTETIHRLEAHVQILSSQMTRLAQAQEVLTRAVIERQPSHRSLRPDISPQADRTPH
jgi:hypothetical protein